MFLLERVARADRGREVDEQRIARAGRVGEEGAEPVVRMLQETAGIHRRGKVHPQRVQAGKGGRTGGQGPVQFRAQCLEVPVERVTRRGGRGQLGAECGVLPQERVVCPGGRSELRAQLVGLSRQRCRASLGLQRELGLLGIGRGPVRAAGTRVPSAPRPASAGPRPARRGAGRRRRHAPAAFEFDGRAVELLPHDVVQLGVTSPGRDEVTPPWRPPPPRGPSSSPVPRARVRVPRPAWRHRRARPQRRT